KKVERGALRAALTQKLRDDAVIVVDALTVDEPKTRAAAALFRTLGATERTLAVDVRLDETVALAARNLAGIRLVPSNRLTARHVMDTARIVVTRAAMERLQEVLS